LSHANTRLVILLGFGSGIDNVIKRGYNDSELACFKLGRMFADLKFSNNLVILHAECLSIVQELAVTRVLGDFA